MRNNSKTVYLCSSCGQDFPKWNGQCPACNEWGTLSEFKVSKSKNSLSNGVKKETLPLEEILHKDYAQRTITGINELDRVLGGGILNGSMILLGGSPGIGKSTLALQVLGSLEKNVLYVSAEESEEQIALRAKRLNILSSNIHLSSENRIDEIVNQINILKPELLIVDSVQTIYSESADSLPGSITQIRECGQKLLQVAKDEKIAVLVIGHVTKEGVIAGPKMLEHMVDTVLYLEGDERQDHRILRSVKNRFGTTNEVGIFQMNSNGLTEVSNPSELFLAERRIDITGSTIFPSLEGTRPILVEIQSLVSPANFNAPQRNVNGFDFKRLSMLLAVLEKRMGYKMGNQDVFVNLVGGLKVNDPAADLSVISALASSEKDKIIKDSIVLIGEVGLGGEIRSVARLEERINETKALGFKELVAPKSSIQRLKSKAKDIKLHAVSHVVEAFNIIFE